MAEQRASQNKFSISEAIRFAWHITIKNFWFIARVLLTIQAIDYLLSLTSSALQESKTIAIQIFGYLILIVGWFISSEFTFAKITIYLKLIDKKKAAVKDLFAYFNFMLIFRYLLISLLLGIGTFIGFLLLIFPGIYFFTTYWFTPYIYVDKRTGIIESFKESAKLTKGIKLKLFLLGIVQTLIIVAGALALLIGLFIAVPMNILSDLYVYRKLSSKK